MKTHKGIKKRLKRTGTGKIVRRRTGRNHLMINKSGKKSRKLCKAKEMASADKRVIVRQYGGLP